MEYNKKHPVHALLVEKITGYINPKDDLDLQRAIDSDEEIRCLWKSICDMHAARGGAFFHSLDEGKAWEKMKAKTTGHK
ncbi:hypothetical protein [Desertivirga xinjiangensis]|uniref:hypothetical protein n=1 Tax=Desertivirga xinjiangensis TaxID=539206 RepID=UPI00210934B3|nr:hypothetical protein [Pedobacter xinjiangensis]